MHSITRWCNQGLLANCACDPSRRGRGHDIYGQFSWGGCSHNLRFASIFARKFIDSQESNLRDATALMNLHNNKVGRKVCLFWLNIYFKIPVYVVIDKQAVLRHNRLICKCHGLSGTCLVRTCWRIAPDFNTVGIYLKYKYNKAIHVSMNQTSKQLTCSDSKRKSHKSDDLIFLDFSPDYCNINNKSGLMTAFIDKKDKCLYDL